MVKVYYALLPELIEESVLPELSEYRQSKLSSVSSIKARQQGVCAELLLEKAVYPDYKRPLPICVTDMGKPYFESGEIHFNISHSGNMVACAIADTQVGFDIQEIKTFDERFAQRFYCDDEIGYIKSSQDKNLAFTEIWCRKESYLKALGLGLRVDLKSFSVVQMREHFESGVIENTCFSVCVPDKNNFKISLEKKLL